MMNNSADGIAAASTWVKRGPGTFWKKRWYAPGGDTVGPPQEYS